MVEIANIQSLAIFGGKPAFLRKLHVGRPNIGKRQLLFDRINDILDNQWLTNNGPQLQEFENHLSRFLEVNNCVVVCNATIGLEILIKACDLKGEVIIPSFTFVATAHALQWQGITPIFCDIDPRTHNIDPDLIEALVTPATTGIFGVHVWGRPCDIEALTKVAHRRKLRLLFDAAHAFGSTYKSKMVGNFGTAEVFSFHATKFFNTFEGGVITTNDDDLAEKIRLMRNFGFSGKDNVISIGTNGKMSEVSAAMGLTGLESIEEFISINYRNYQIYRDIFSELPGMEMITYDEDERSNYQYIIVEINEEITGINRDLIIDILEAENILARRYFYPGCHEMEPYRSLYPYYKDTLSETERLSKSVMSLPTGTAITPDDILKIGELLKLVIDHSAEIKARLSDDGS